VVLKRVDTGAQQIEVRVLGTLAGVAAVAPVTSGALQRGDTVKVG
jgi:hypothetical protein